MAAACRAFWGSFPQAGVPLGNLLATAVLLILSIALPEEAFLSWRLADRFLTGRMG